jgi:hypothetical protein
MKNLNLFHLAHIPGGNTLLLYSNFLMLNLGIQLNCAKYCSDIIEQGLIITASYGGIHSQGIGYLTYTINGQQSNVESDY